MVTRMANSKHAACLSNFDHSDGAIPTAVGSSNGLRMDRGRPKGSMAHIRQ
jgi:hypothetical protein